MQFADTTIHPPLFTLKKLCNGEVYCHDKGIDVLTFLSQFYFMLLPSRRFVFYVCDKSYKSKMFSVQPNSLKDTRHAAIGI